jgi:hypothetical protein
MEGLTMARAKTARGQLDAEAVGHATVSRDGELKILGGKRTPGLELLDSPAGREFIAALRRQVDSIPKGPEHRLRWVLDFVKQNLDELRPDQRVSLGYDLRLAALNYLPGGLVGTMESIPDDTLRDYQRNIREGLRGLLSKHPTSWSLPATPRLEWNPRVAHTGQRFRIGFEGGEEAGIITGVAHLVLELGERLRGCSECGDPYVAVKRQSYCSHACSLKARYRRRDARRGRSPRIVKPRRRTRKYLGGVK